MDMADKLNQSGMVFKWHNTDNVVVTGTAERVSKIHSKSLDQSMNRRDLAICICYGI